MSDTMSAKEQERDNATGSESRALKEQCDVIRDRCLEEIRRATSYTFLGEADIKVYEDMVLSDASFELVGKSSDEEKLTALRENLHTLIPLVINQAQTLEEQFQAGLSAAEKSGGISKNDMERWKDRLNDSSVIFMKKKDFIVHTFPTYVKNWKELGIDLKKIKDEAQKMNLGVGDMPELKAVFAAGFLDSHYLYKRDRANAALAALAAYEKGDYKAKGGLYEIAREKLRDAVHDGVISEWKVGEWMKRIFANKGKPDVMKKFITGSGAKTLTGLIHNWTHVREKFDKIENLRKEKGSPLSFHFVHIDVFLDWNYKKREAYVDEAEHRFKDIDNEPYIFLKIRNALDVKDWEEAEQLIARAEQGAETSEHHEKLRSMKQYLIEHRGGPSSTLTASEANDQQMIQANDALREALDQIPYQSVKNRFIRALHYDYDTFWALCTMYYNWEWCRQRGYSTDEKDVDFMEIAKEETYDHLEHGQPRDYAINDFTSDTATEPAGRSDNDTKSPQVIHVDESTDNGALVKYIHHNRHNRSVWYWTRLVEKDIPFEHIQAIVKHIQPTLKRSARTLFQNNYIPNPYGRPHKRNSLYEQGMKPSMN